MINGLKYLYNHILTSSTYAEQHFNKMGDKNNFICNNFHSVMGRIELIPLIGGLAGAIEGGCRLVSSGVNLIGSLLSSSQKAHQAGQRALSSETRRESSVEEEPITEATHGQTLSNTESAIAPPTSREEKQNKASEKMQKNLRKAITEHMGEDESSKDVIATLEDIESHATSSPVSIGTSLHAGDIGRRGAMEDAHIILDVEGGRLLGVFDGHGGSDVSKFASERFPSIFSQKLKETSTIRDAFNVTMAVIHEEIRENQTLDLQGSTAVVSFVDKAASKIYTATLGDSEAFIFRKIGTELKCIPLSAVRDWTSEKDAKRRADNLRSQGYQVENSNAGINPKLVRYPLEGWTLNVSRALGDVDVERYEGNLPKGISIKPKITETSVQKGDIILHVCDGITDNLKIHEITDIVNNCSAVKGLPQVLIDRVKSKWNNGDNMTVLATVIE